MALNNSRIIYPPITTGFNNDRIVSFAGLTDVVILLSQAPYMSNITVEQQYYPATISMVAGKGCNYMILELFEKLAIAEIIRDIQTEPNTFPIV
jgi:hypothetical protein